MVWFEINGWQASASCFVLGSAFVGSLYLLRLVARPIHDLAHEDPRQIKARFACVGLVSAASPLMLLFWAGGDGPTGPTGLGYLEWAGVRSEGLLPALVLPLSLAVTLFLGPLVGSALSLLHHRAERPGRSVPLTFVFPNLSTERYARARNLLVAPLAEEIVFRALMAPLLVRALPLL